jgi:hypothetical protein
VNTTTCAPSARELHRHVPEPAEPDDADALARPDAVMAQRRPGRDARADQRGSAGEVEILRYAQREALVDHDALGIAAVVRTAEVAIPPAVGLRLVGAELLEAREAFAAAAVGIDQAADGGDVADRELADGRADARDAPDDLVAGHAGIGRRKPLPLAAHHVQVRMADAAVEDLDLHVTGRRVTAPDGRRRERGGGARGGIGSGGVHGHRLLIRGERSEYVRRVSGASRWNPAASPGQRGTSSEARRRRQDAPGSSSWCPAPSPKKRAGGDRSRPARCFP